MTILMSTKFKNKYYYSQTEVEKAYWQNWLVNYLFSSIFYKNKKIPKVFKLPINLRLLVRVLSIWEYGNYIFLTLSLAKIK